MKFESIDTLQKTLADEVFTYTSDRKKASGRALGTLVEIIIYYVLRSWGLSNYIVVERRIPEFANSEITHNVEFSLHPVKDTFNIEYNARPLPVTPAKLKSYLPVLQNQKLKSIQILSSDGLKRNAAVLLEKDNAIFVANLESLDKSGCNIVVNELFSHPFAVFECKRVGVEEGARKGPQTIEKAKQGAYVAKTISSLQKIRLRNGEFQGIIEGTDGEFSSGPYLTILRDVIQASSHSEYPGFILTVGVVSNHGNWFSTDNHTKELAVLAQSYDWLLFLTDHGLSKFIDNLLLNPTTELEAARNAFLASYHSESKKNRFTKVQVDLDADKSLQVCFANHQSEIDSWFNIIAPKHASIKKLRRDLKTLCEKDLLE